MKNTNGQKLVVDTYESLEESGNFGYEISYWNESGDSDDTIVDLKYGFKSHKAAEKAGKVSLKKLKAA